jgi:hypothetical protein
MRPYLIALCLEALAFTLLPSIASRNGPNHPPIRLQTKPGGLLGATLAGWGH